jgi:hypothetical protein
VTHEELLKKLRSAGFTPLSPKLVQALGGDHIGALLLAWLIHRQELNEGAPVIIRHPQVDKALAMSRKQYARASTKLEQMGLLTRVRRRMGTEFEVFPDVVLDLFEMSPKVTSQDVPKGNIKMYPKGTSQDVPKGNIKMSQKGTSRQSHTAKSRPLDLL